MKEINDIENLRKRLLNAVEEIDDDPASVVQAREIGNLAGKVIGTIRCELEYARITKRKPVIPFLEASREDSSNPTGSGGGSNPVESV
jgi:hypothetical protein